MRIALGVIAVILNAIGYYPYLRDIIRGIVQPHRVTWGIFSILTAIASVNQIENGGGYSSLFFASTFILVFITFLFSIKKGHGCTSKIDITCVVLTVLLLVYWVTAKDVRISTLLAIMIDVIAVIPTLIKTYNIPKSEIYPPWMLAGIGGLISLLAVPKLDWVLIIYPAYIFVANYIIVFTKFYSERKQIEESN